MKSSKIIIITLYTIISLSLAYSQAINTDIIRDRSDLLKDINLSGSSGVSRMIGISDFENEIQNQLNLDSLDSNIFNIESQDKSINPNSGFDNRINNRDTTIVPEIIFDLKEDIEEETSDLFHNSKTEVKYFGYDIFNSSPDFFQNALSLTVDPDYPVGPGDEIIVMLWGETELNKRFFVSRDGYLFIPNVGQIFVNGLTLERLEKKLFKQLSKVYSTLSGSKSNPTTFFDLSLGNKALKPQRVFVLGEVENPGAYSVKASTSLFTSLFYFNGPSINGSLRDIHLLRNNKKIATIDFYDYLLTGVRKNDKNILKDDVIFFPRRLKTITVIGSSFRPAIYELKNDEGLLDLMNISGGLTSSTYLKRARITRTTPFESRNISAFDREIIDIDLNNTFLAKKDIDLFDGDLIEFFYIKDEIKGFVAISGAVERPGRYQVAEGLSLSELIAKSDGFLGDAFRDKIEIIRTNLDGTESIISASYDDDNNLINSDEISIQSKDSVIVYYESDMLDFKDVSIDGYVLRPGAKDFREGMTVYDLIFSGGGFELKDRIKNTYLKKANLFRRKIGSKENTLISFPLDSVLNGKSISNNYIEMGDSIVIYSNEDIFGKNFENVEAVGFFKRPGTYPYFEKMRVSDLFNLASTDLDSSYLQELYLKRSEIIRVDKFEEFVIPLELEDLILNRSGANNLFLKPGDKVTLYEKSLFEAEDEVLIYGDVSRPGIYKKFANLRLSDLILKSGIEGVVNPKFRIEISRNNEDNDNSKMTSKVIFANKNDIGKLDGTKILHKDIILVLESESQDIAKSVNISGEVQYPGVYYIDNNSTLVTDIINRSGGLTSSAYPISSQLIRSDEVINLSFSKILKNPKSKLNFTLMDGDSILIKSKPNIVKLAGEINSPGNYQFIKGLKISDYLKNAGGFTQNSSKGGIFIKYPNGISKKYSLYNPLNNLRNNVLDGSVITVLPKDVVVPFNFTEYVTNLTSIYSDLMQALLLVRVLGQE